MNGSERELSQSGINGENGTQMRDAINDILLSLLSGIALLIVVRAAYGLSVGWLPDLWLMNGDNPLARLAFARLVLFTMLVAVCALPLSWPLAKHAASRNLNAALPGAACAALLFLLLETAFPAGPFPRWLAFACTTVLFAALPAGTMVWWRLHSRETR